MEPIPDRLIVLTFDDGKKSNATFVAPLLRRHGFGATFFITEGLEFSDKSRYMDWDEIKGLHDAGFEIGNHHGNHVDVTTQSREEFIRDLEQVERSCAARGIDVPTTYGYPGGHHDLGRGGSAGRQGVPVRPQGDLAGASRPRRRRLRARLRARRRSPVAGTVCRGERRVPGSWPTCAPRRHAPAPGKWRCSPSTGCPTTIPGAIPTRACSRDSCPGSRPTITR